jgi:accessory colonization factor AcfC
VSSLALTLILAATAPLKLWHAYRGGEEQALQELAKQFTSETGTTYVIKAGPEFKLLATNELGAILLSTPAVSDKVLYIRTADNVLAIAE